MAVKYWQQIFVSTWTTCLAILIVTEIQKVASISCSQCDYEKDGMACLMKPPQPTDCWDQFKHCMTTVVFNGKGRVASFSRSCGPFPFEDECTLDTDGLSTVCYATCTKDACNAKHTLPYLLSLTRRVH